MHDFANWEGFSSRCVKFIPVIHVQHEYAVIELKVLNPNAQLQMDLHTVHSYIPLFNQGECVKGNVYIFLLCARIWCMQSYLCNSLWIMGCLCHLGLILEDAIPCVDNHVLIWKPMTVGDARESRLCQTGCTCAVGVDAHHPNYRTRIRLRPQGETRAIQRRLGSYGTIGEVSWSLHQYQSDPETFMKETHVDAHPSWQWCL